LGGLQNDHFILFWFSLGMGAVSRATQPAILPVLNP